jgi:Arc/MetJ family transcription regulator
MRTNIVIDDKLMASAMAAGNFKSKREVVEEGLRLIARRKVYDGLLALRGQLQWDDSDEGWAKAAQERALEAPATTAHEPEAVYKVIKNAKAVPKRKAR